MPLRSGGEKVPLVAVPTASRSGTALGTYKKFETVFTGVAGAGHLDAGAPDAEVEVEIAEPVQGQVRRAREEGVRHLPGCRTLEGEDRPALPGVRHAGVRSRHRADSF